MNGPALPPDLLERYLTGTCTPAEARRVEAWYAAFEGEPDFPEANDPGYTQRLWLRIRERIGQPVEDDETVERPLWFRRWPLAVSAAATVALVVGFWAFSGKKEVAPPVEPPALADVETWVSLANRTRSVSKHTLTDGSAVWLSPGTELRYAPTFGRSRREVTLKGEAFFEVTRDTLRPFVIQAGAMRTEVLGTSFNVRAYPQSPRFEVSVVSGKVAVSGSRPESRVLLEKRQQAVFNPTNASLTRAQLPLSAKPQLWEPTTIQFEWASLGAVARALEDAFDVSITFSNPALKNCRLRADFTNLRLPVILDLLCQATDATYSLDGRNVRLDGAGCP